MFTTPDQMVAMHKAYLESFQAVAAKSFEGLEKLAELNLAATKTTFEESAEQMKALMEIKDVKAFADLAAGSAQPAADKMSAYAKHVYEITTDTGTEITKLSRSSSRTATANCTPPSTRSRRTRPPAAKVWSRS
jgi:phasin family protein